MAKKPRNPSADRPPTPPALPLRPLNKNQGKYLAAMETDQQVIVLGPAGTGKTFIAATAAADGLLSGRYERIVLTRPNVPGGSGISLGAFPGNKDEKMANWVQPVISRLKARMGPAAYDAALRRGAIEVVPFETMRGASWEQAFILLDEAQNATYPDIKMFLTRIGQGSKVVINGDVSQSDLGAGPYDGLSIALHLALRYSVRNLIVVEFGIADIVRSEACAEWVKAFHQFERGCRAEAPPPSARGELDEWVPDREALPN